MTSLMVWFDSHPLLGAILIGIAVNHTIWIIITPFQLLTLSNRVRELEKRIQKMEGKL